MEVIGMGILLMIGFYLAPVVIGVVVIAVGAILAGISSLFGGK